MISMNQKLPKFYRETSLNMNLHIHIRKQKQLVSPKRWEFLFPQIILVMNHTNPQIVRMVADSLEHAQYLSKNHI